MYGATGFPQHTHPWLRVEQLRTIEVCENSERGHAMIGVTAKFGVQKQPGERTRVLRREPETLERHRKATPQVIDPNQPRGIGCALGHGGSMWHAPAGTGEAERETVVGPIVPRMSRIVPLAPSGGEPRRVPWPRPRPARCRTGAGRGPAGPSTCRDA